MLESGEGWASGDKVTARASQAATEFFGMAFHGYHITHIDSLAHFFWQGKMYNGRPPHLVSTGLDATVESVEIAKPASWLWGSRFWTFPTWKSWRPNAKSAAAGSS